MSNQEVYLYDEDDAAPGPLPGPTKASAAGQFTWRRVDNTCPSIRHATWHCPNLPDGVFRTVTPGRGVRGNNETMGTMHQEPYNETGRRAFEFQMRFVDGLSQNTPIPSADGGGI